MNAQRALLDQLMGADRDLDEGDVPRSIDWHDAKYCRYHLCGFCPHNMFANTKSDIGRCTQEHSDEARSLFQRESRRNKRPLELEMVTLLQGLLQDLDR